MQLNLETHALGMKLQIRRYLVDETEARNTDRNTENYKFAYSDMQKMEGIDREARVATLVSPTITPTVLWRLSRSIQAQTSG